MDQIRFFIMVQEGKLVDMVFDKNWEEIAQRVEGLKKEYNDLKQMTEKMSQTYEQAAAQYATNCFKIKVVVTQCCDYEQRLSGVPERNRQIREAFDSSEGILTYLGRLMEYEKNDLKKEDSSRDIYVHFYSEIVSVLAVKLNTLARQLDELQKYYQGFDREEYQALLLQNFGGMPDGRIDNQFSMKVDRIKNQISRQLREISRKYKKKGLPIYHQYFLSDDTSKLRKLKQQTEELTVGVMLMESKEEETENMLKALEDMFQQHKLDLQSDSTDMRYAAVYNKLRLLFTHDQLARLNSSGYTQIEYTQLVKAFCNSVRNALKAQPVIA